MRSKAGAALARLAADHAAAARADVAPERVRTARALGRRAFVLGALGAAGGALLVPASTGTARARGRERIAIVGAGIAGLSCALALHDAGIAATVFEAAGRLGGRMHSERGYWNDGQHTEWCGAMIDSKHRNLHALARRFGLTLVDTDAAQPAGARDTAYFDGRYYPLGQADRDFAPVYRTLQQQLRGTGGRFVTWDRATPLARELDALSLQAWIARYVPGGAGSQLGRLLTDAYWNEYGRDPAEQSALNLVAMLGIQPDHGSGELDILGYSDQRYFIAHGNQQLPLAIARALPAGSIRTRSVLRGLRKLPGGTYELRLDTPAGPRSERFDRVVLALPFSVLRSLDYAGAGFDARKTRAIEQLGYGIHTKLQVQFARPLWRHGGPWPQPTTGQIWTDLGFQDSVDFTVGQPGTAGILERFTAGTAGLVDVPPTPYARAADSPAVGRQARKFLAMVERVWPGVARAYNGKAAYGNTQLDPFVRGSYSCWLVGQYTAFAGYEGVRQGRVHFAGEHCSVRNQGFMEGGAETGIAAAQEILTDYGVRLRAAG